MLLALRAEQYGEVYSVAFKVLVGLLRQDDISHLRSVAEAKHQLELEMCAFAPSIS